MNRITLLMAFVLIVIGCSSPQEKQIASENIAVRWTLVTNFTDKPDVFEAKFELINNSDQALTNKNWTLFFNMAPRQLLTPEIPQSATLHHINGDWYRLVPAESFSLQPGESVTINYRSVEAVIKETDRTMGLYFVFYDDGGMEEKISEVNDYEWTAFTEEDQINRNKADEDPIPTAEWTYKNNLNFSIDADSVKKRIVPSPIKIKTGSEVLNVSNEMEIFFQDGLENEAKYLAASLKDLTGQDFKTVTTPSSKKAISLQLRKKEGINSAEAYSLEVDADGIRIKGSDAAGVFYGIQSLRAMIPVATYQRRTSSFSLQHVVVEDAPR